MIPRLPVQVRLTGEVPEACYRSSLCAQGTPVGDADEQLNAQMLRRGGRGRVGSRAAGTGAPPLIIAAQFPICPLGPVGGMNLDRVVGRWELAAAARVSVGPSDKTRPNQTRPRPGPARRARAGGRAGGVARLGGGGGARVWPPGSPSQLVYVRVLRLTI